MGALAALGGGNTVQATNTGGTSTLTFGSFTALVAGGGATVNFVTSGGVNGTTNSIVLTGTAAGFVNGGAFFNGTNFAYMNSTGGFVRAPVYGTDSGFTTVAANPVGGFATLTGTNAHNQILAGTSGVTNNGVTTVTQAAAVTEGSLKFNGVTSLATGGLVTIQTAANSRGGIIATGGAVTITGPGGIASGGSGDLILDVPLSGDSLSISAPLTSGTTGGLTVTGAGTVFLSNPTNLVGTNNNFTGSIWIDNATLSIAGTGITDPTTLGSSTGRTLFLNGGTFQLTGTNGMYTVNKTFQINQAGGTLDVGSSALTIGIVGSTAANFLTGTGNLTIGGNTTNAGLVFLNDASNFSGNIYVGAGTLRLSSYNNAAGTGTLIVGSGATLDVAFPGLANTSGTTGAIANPLILNGTGVGGNGAMQNGSPFASYLSGGITLAGSTTNSIVTGGLGNLIESGNITDNQLGYSLTKGGAGTLFLTGTSNYLGGTFITGGALQIGLGATTGTILGPVTLSNNSALIFDRPDSAGYYFAGAISGAGSVTQAGTYGSLVLTGQNSYTGATNVNSGGTLSVEPGALASMVGGNLVGSSVINVGTTTTSQLDFFAAGRGGHD